MLPEFEQAGFQINAAIFPPGVIDDLIAKTEELGVQAGTRTLLDRSWCRELAGSRELLALVTPILGKEALPVRGIFFDKVPTANWLVPWHQDTKIVVKERIDVPGYSGWSVKEGETHVLPPVTVLERMLAVRLHVDDCQASNGPVVVAPGTHRQGIIPLDAVAAVADACEPVVCSCCAGDALLMRPLLLHRSSKSDSPSHRRVIHIEYASCHLEGGLEWRYA